VAEHADGEVAQGCHDLRRGPGAELGGVCCEGDVADVVQAVLDRPVAADEVGQPGGAGLRMGQAGDRVGGLGLAAASGAPVADLGGDPEDLGGVREAQAAHADRLEGAELHPANGMHALRHFYALVLLDAGESIKALRSVSGTATPASPCGPTPTCSRPVSSGRGRPSTARSRVLQRQSTACTRPSRATEQRFCWSAACFS
jgi:hypothetical protein